MQGSSSPMSVSTKLRKVAELARQNPKMVLNTLSHYIDKEWLLEAYRRTRKDAAVGVDGQTAKEYAEELDANLQSLLNRFKSGSYYAPPVRRVHIPKGSGGKTRPIGIPTFEDKILQRSVSMLLEAIYEQDFLQCSYGFRPGRSAHQALSALWQQVMKMGGCWLLEVDISSYYDTIRGEHLRDFLDQRVRDGVLRRMIDKWLKAGVMEEGRLHRPESGTPQGGVVSPILSNIYLHYVLDEWFERQVKQRLSGQAFLIRYADDFVIGFTNESDAHRVMEVLPKRFGKYGLTLHPDKTRLIDFRKPGTGYRPQGSNGGTGNGSFDLLGFTHFWRKSRKGSWIVGRKTAPSRLTRALKQVAQLCRKHMHEKVVDQHQRLTSVLRGHYAYYGITGNGGSLARFYHEVRRIWRKWLDRRSHKARMNWERFARLSQRYRLPLPRVVHSVYPMQLDLRLRSRMR